jgi:hypothetical protein
VVIVTGSLLYAWQDIQFSADGYWWLSVNAVLYVISNFYNKWCVGCQLIQIHTFT